MEDITSTLKSANGNAITQFMSRRVISAWTGHILWLFTPSSPFRKSDERWICTFRQRLVALSHKALLKLSVLCIVLDPQMTQTLDIVGMAMGVFSRASKHVSLVILLVSYEAMDS